MSVSVSCLVSNVTPHSVDLLVQPGLLVSLNQCFCFHKMQANGSSSAYMFQVWDHCQGFEVAASCCPESQSEAVEDTFQFLPLVWPMTIGQRSWWVDWMSWVLRCDQRSAELIGWLDELGAPVWLKVSRADGLTGWAGCSVWPKVSRADGLTRWAGCSGVIKGQQSW